MSNSQAQEFPERMALIKGAREGSGEPDDINRYLLNMVNAINKNGEHGTMMDESSCLMV